MHFNPVEESIALGPNAVDTTSVDMTSGRLRGLDPEFGLLATGTLAVMTMTASLTNQGCGATSALALR